MKDDTSDRISSKACMTNTKIHSFLCGNVLARDYAAVGKQGPGCLVHHCHLIQCLARSRCSAIQTEWKCNILTADCGGGGI